MFNVTVLKLKDIIKFLIEALVVVLIIVLCSKIFNKNLSNAMPDTLHVMSTVDNNTDKKEIDNKNYLESFLETELSTTKIVNENELDSKDIIEIEESKQELVENEPEQEIIQEVLGTEIVTNNPIKLSYNTEYYNVKIKNETSYELTNEILNPDITISNKNILLFHTHTCESYTSSEQYTYTPTGTFRTTDQNYSVVKVGDELEKYMKEYGYNVIHNKTYHDYPSYNGSYTRSLETVNNILTNTPSEIVWDVHRDAIGSRSDYAPTVKIGENDYAAQIMFVIGTNVKICSKSSRKSRRNVSRVI